MSNIAHSERAHAKLSASGSAMWLNCPGSINATANYANRSSKAADEGTIAHEIADRCLQKGVDADVYVGKNIGELKIESGSFPPEYVIEKDMGDYVQEYLDYVRSHETDNSILYTELRVDFSHVVEDGFGTLDSAVLDLGKKTLHIFDLKYGIRVQVEAYLNTQGRMYAIGMLNEIGFLNEFDTVRIHIVQPRKRNFSYWDVSVRDLVEFSKFVKERAELALKEDAPRIAGDKQCEWCDAKKDCAVAKKFFDDALLNMFDDMDAPMPDINVLTVEQKAHVLKYKSFVTKFIDAIEKDAFKILMSGENFPGMKLVQGSASRVFKEDAEKILVEKLGEAAYNKKLIGIGDAEKLLGKKEVAELAFKPIGKVTMVADSNRRPAVEPESVDVSDEFDDMEADDL